MEKILHKLFSEYLSESKVIQDAAYAEAAKAAVAKEKELRTRLDAEQIKCFEEWTELSSQIHYLEVKDAFFRGCKIGADVSKEFSI